MKKLALLFFVFIASFVMSESGISAAKPEPRIETIEAYQTRNGAQCNFFNGCVQAGTDVTIHLAGIAYNNGEPLEAGSTVKVRLKGNGTGCSGYPAAGFASIDFTETGATWNVPGNKVDGLCSYELVVKVEANQSDSTGDDKQTTNKTYVATSNTTQATCSEEQCNTDLTLVARYDFCAQIDEEDVAYEKCTACFGDGGVWTAVGCIPSDPESVVKTIITIGLTLAGAVVLVMILVGAFMLSVSQGDPNITKEAKEIITSAIMGLLFVIFSVAILQFIGVNILRIPGFGES